MTVDKKILDKSFREGGTLRVLAGPQIIGDFIINSVRYKNHGLNCGETATLELLGASEKDDGLKAWEEKQLQKQFKESPFFGGYTSDDENEDEDEEAMIASWYVDLEEDDEDEDGRPKF